MPPDPNAQVYARSWKRTALVATLSLAIGLVGSLVVAEIVLRFFPVAVGPQALGVNARSPIFRYAPGERFTWSIGWDFGVINRGRTNNYGFVNDQNYDSSLSTPLLAVVGDSYVEALMVRYEATIQGRLSRLVSGRGRVYSFGVSGAALTQYLAEAEFARATFKPNGLVVVIVGNDFDESLLRYKQQFGLHYFKETRDGLRLTRMDYSPNAFRRVLKWFALARYLIFNLRLSETVSGLMAWRKEATEQPVQFVGNTAAGADSQRVRDSRRVVDEFLAELPSRSGLERSRILLVVDGMRPNLYSPVGLTAAGGSYFDLMRQYLIAVARRAGFEVIDMQPRFIERYRRDSARFEFPTDGHWNAIGHEEAAGAVAKSAVFQRTFGLLGPIARRRRR